ncbi:hypothetical protein [Bacillus sp. 1P06AnD]|uniref:hypothetical protein n=1 Tax=Bacillus sp. 1P06AnD TaxID=3132208 RepID=UPI00399EFF44
MDKLHGYVIEGENFILTHEEDDQPIIFQTKEAAEEKLEILNESMHHLKLSIKSTN